MFKYPSVSGLKPEPCTGPLKRNTCIKTIFSLYCPVSIIRCPFSPKHLKPSHLSSFHLKIPLFFSPPPLMLCLMGEIHSKSLSDHLSHLVQICSAWNSQALALSLKIRMQHNGYTSTWKKRLQTCFLLSENCPPWTKFTSKSEVNFLSCFHWKIRGTKQKSLQIFLLKWISDDLYNVWLFSVSLEILKVWLHNQAEAIHTDVVYRSSKSPVKNINPFSIQNLGRDIIGL